MLDPRLVTAQPQHPLTPGPALLRQVGPPLVLGMGVMGGVAWAGMTRGALSSSPPYLLAQGALGLASLVVAARGVPRWGYPWLAFGIGGAYALVQGLVLPSSPSEGTLPPAAVLGLLLTSGYALTVLVAALIAARGWGDAAAFVALYLTSVGMGLPGLRPSPGEFTPGLEAARVALLVVQVVLAGAAIVTWWRRAFAPSSLLFGALLLLFPLSLALLLPRTGVALPEDFSVPGFLVSSGTLYLFIAMVTFAVGAVRRVLSGQGVLVGRQPSGPGT